MPRKRLPLTDAQLKAQAARLVKNRAAGPSAEASAAGSALAKRRAALAKPGEFRALGLKGAAAYWGQFTQEERRLEMARRRLLGKKNRRARIAKLLS